MKKILTTLAISAGMCLNAVAGNVVTDTLGFDRMNASTPAELTRGKVSGVRVSLTDGGVNSVVNTTIRGLNSLRGSSEPLWVIDGAILSPAHTGDMNAFWQDCYGKMSYTSGTNPLAFINPYDIESIEILKDLSATALYGSRGANGVIVIKTRQASVNGRTIEWNSNLGVATGLGTAVVHNHNVSLEGLDNRNAYRVSAFFRSKPGIAGGEKAIGGGLNVNFDSKANKTVWFGVKSTINVNNSNSQAGTSWYGAPSAMVNLRTTGNYDGYVSDFDDITRSFRTVDDVYLQINFLPSLSWKTDLGIDYANNTEYIWYGNGTEFGRSVNGAAAIVQTSRLQYKVNTQLDFSTFIARKHKISACVGAEFSGYDEKSDTKNGSDFFNHQLRAKGLSFQGGNTKPRLFEHTVSHIAVFARAAYDYSGIAGATLSLRADNTRRFDDSRFVLYPAGEAYLDVRRLAGIGGALSGLKLKAGYGTAGREGLVPFESFARVCPDMVVPFIQPGTESLYEGVDRTFSREWHAGFDFSLASDRVAVSAEYYEKNTADDLAIFCSGQRSGESIRWVRAAREQIGFVSSSFRNRGIEIDLNALAVDRGGFRWSLDANVTFQSNQITSIAEEDRFGAGVGSAVRPGYNEIGKSISSIIGGMSPLAPIEDIRILGNPSPKLFGGIATTLSWKGFTLNAAFDGAAGHQVLNMNAMLRDGADEVVGKYVEDADFVRMNDLSLSYLIPFKVKWIKSFKVSVSAKNLFTATKYSGYNPDVDCFSGLVSCRGIDYGSFPITKTILLGVSVKF